MTTQAGMMGRSSQDAALSYSGGHCHCLSQFRIFECQLSGTRAVPGTQLPKDSLGTVARPCLEDEC